MTDTKILSSQSPASAALPQSTYNYALGYLRAFLVVLVVAHHAALAYFPNGPTPPVSLDAPLRWWQAFPVVDTQHGTWASLLVGFNDSFFMSLMFLVSGLFVWSGLKQKGTGGFLRGRLLRLGLPFVVAAGIVAPIAYYPTFLQIPGHGGIDSFAHQWLSIGVWPAGPAWFIWVLLVFDCIAAMLFAVAPGWAATLGRFLAGPQARPARFFALLLLTSAAVYVPLELKYSGLVWSAFGPFTFQTSRIIHYLVYFLAGVGIGAYGLERGPLTSHGKLAARWLLWAIGAAVIFLVSSTVAIVFVTQHIQSRAWNIWTDLFFAASCASSSFAFLAIFLRFARARSNMFGSLSRNSYGIYLVHYAFVSWFLLAMTGTPLPAFLKFGVVLAAAVAASWVTTIAIRRIPGVAKVV